jgi:hypothetical protein
MSGWLGKIEAIFASFMGKNEITFPALVSRVAKCELISLAAPKGLWELDRGIAEITCVIVDDSMDHVGTKRLLTNEKKKIIDFLIRNETYLYVSLQSYSIIMDDESNPN